MSPKEYIEPVAIQMYKRSQTQEQSYLKMISHFSIFLSLYKSMCKGHEKLENESKCAVMYM